MPSYIGDSNRWPELAAGDSAAWSMDAGGSWPHDGDYLVFDGVADAGVASIIASAPDPMGSLDRFEVQAAIWWYLSETGRGEPLAQSFMGTSHVRNDGDPYHARKRIAELVEAAKSAPAGAPYAFVPVIYSTAHDGVQRIVAAVR
jgi:hypothetical protein